MISRNSTGTALRLTSLAAAIALALFVTISFLCAAAFVYVLQNYGLIQACLTGAGVFLRGHADRGHLLRGAQETGSQAARARRAAKSAMHTALADPMLVATGIQIDPRHRHQEADPDPGGRRIGAGIAGQPQRAAERRSAGGVALRSHHDLVVNRLTGMHRSCRGRFADQSGMHGASRYGVEALAMGRYAATTKAALRSRSGRAGAAWRPRSAR